MQMLVHTGLLCIVKILKKIFFDSFRVEHAPKEIEKFMGHKNKNKHI